MPDLLAHVLFAYGICTFLSLRYDWISPHYRTIGMLGALIPDFYKIYLLVPNVTVESLVGLPFNWFALRTGGGVVIAALMAAMVFVSSEQRRGLSVLLLGAASHLVLDLFLTTPTGHAFPILWPLTSYRPLTPNLYQSTQPTVTMAFIVFAFVAFAVVYLANRTSIGD